MIKSIEEIKKGDIVYYRNRRVNNVNKPYKYKMYYDSYFRNINFGKGMEIVRIERYVKIGFIYIKKCIYKR